LFLLWVYVLWILVLFGLRIAFLVQHKRMWVLWSAWKGTTIGQVIVHGLQPNASAELSAPAGTPWIDPTSLVSILAEVGRCFASGRPAPSSRVAEALGLDESAVNRGLTHLENAGLIHTTGNATAPENYTLSRPAERIALGDILLLGYQLLGTLRPGAEPAVVFNLRQAQIEAAKGRTLADVLATSPGGAGSTCPMPATPPPGPSKSEVDLIAGGDGSSVTKEDVEEEVQGKSVREPLTGG
jgi:hypothetical protein